MKTASRFWQNFLLSTLVFAGWPATAGMMDQWVTKKVSTNHTGLSFVVYGNGRYVAYGTYSDYGAIMSSEDGANWTLRNDGGASGSGLSYSVGLYYAGGKFFGKYFAFGGFGVSAYSNDGIAWTTFPFPLVTGLAYNGTRYVVTANDPYNTPAIMGVLTSSNGVNWTPPQGGLSASLSDIAYGNGRFVALGSGNNSGHAYTSTDGSFWTDNSIAAGGQTISFCGGLFILPLGSGTNLISASGLNWDTRNTGIASIMHRVIYTHGIFLALTAPCNCFFTSLAVSTNGTNWFEYSKPLPTLVLNLATDGNRLLTVSDQYIDVNHSDGFVHYLDPAPSLLFSSAPPAQVAISGLVGRSLRLESIDALSNPPLTWQSNATFVLPSDPYLWTDPTVPPPPQRFYRAIMIP